MTTVGGAALTVAAAIILAAAYMAVIAIGTPFALLSCVPSLSKRR